MRKITKIDKVQSNEKMRVAAYIRVSTDSEDQLISFKTQKAHYKRIISENKDYDFVGIYFDEGISGTKTENREGLLRLLKDCKSGLIDLVLTKSISRLARNTTDCLEIVRKLLDSNVGIYFEKENIDTRNMESELMLSILSSLAESESRSMSENIKWSIQKRFKAGTYLIATPPYGYKNVEKEMVVDANEAIIIKDIFEAYLSGKGTDRIASWLNKNKVPTKRGGKWSSNTVGEILKNEAYVGDMLFQKTYTDEEYNRHWNNGEKDQYLIKDNHEPIISREDFYKVQELIKFRALEKGNGNSKERYSKRYSLSGKIKCGICSSKFRRRHHYSGDNTYIAWACSGRIRNKDSCSMLFIRDDDVKTAFSIMLNKLIYGKKIILQPLLSTLQNIDDKKEREKIALIEEELNRLKERKQVLEKLITSGVLEPSVYRREDLEISSKEKQLLSERARCKSTLLGAGSKVIELEKLIQVLSNTEMLNEFSDELFTTLVDHIVVVDRKVYDFHLKCGLVLREEIEDE